MHSNLTLLTVAVVLLSWTGIGVAGEDGGAATLPAEAAQAVTTRFPGARIVSTSREVEESVTKYEVKLTDADGQRQVEVAADGTICEIEGAVAEATVPSAVRHAAKAVVGRGILQGITRLQVYAVAVEGQVARLASTLESYEYRFAEDGKTTEATFAADGRLVKSELAGHDDDGKGHDRGHADEERDDD